MAESRAPIGITVLEDGTLDFIDNLKRQHGEDELRRLAEKRHEARWAFACVVYQDHLEAAIAAVTEPIGREDGDDGWWEGWDDHGLRLTGLGG